MKLWCLIGRAVLGVFLLGVMCPNHAPAQGYSIGWSRLAGGSGSSTNATFSLTGTMGQTEAGGRLTGGGYSLTGGFRADVALVQTPGLPTLNLRLMSPVQAIVSWPLNTQGFALLETTNLSSGVWITNLGPVVDTATEHTVMVSATSGRRFFRLQR